jgi:hypothetical protein
MQVWQRYVLIVFVFFCGTSTQILAQRAGMALTGIIYDSLTLEPLSFATVINETANNGTTSDENGAFRLIASPGDSILFTILGYSRKTRVVRGNEQAMIVFLREFALTLSPVTIYSSFKPHGSDQWSSAIQKQPFIHNPTGPGSGYVVETFGPGVTLGGLITKMFKSEKEKKKLNTIREKAKQSETYLSVIVSEDTKRYFQQTFSMSEAEYNAFIESFNLAHPEAVYIESRDEIMNRMVAFLASRKK